MEPQLEYPRLLPSVLIPEHADAKRTTRDWIVDVLCILASVLIGAIAFASTHVNHVYPQWFVVLDVVAGGVSCLAVWTRRRRPLGLAVVLVVVAIFSSATGGAAAVALFTLAVHRPFRQAAPVAALALATLPANIVIFPGDESFVVNLVFGVVVVGAVLAWGMFIRARRQLVFSLRDRAQRAETEQQLRVDQARQHERARIAREMHDVLAHRISLLSLHAGALEFRPDAPPEEIERAAGVIRASAHQALEDLRAVIGVLRDSPEDAAPERPQPTLGDLPALLDESRAAGMRVSYEGRLADDAAVPESMGRNAYRIVQEGLTNARKHARGSAVEVRLAGAPGDGLELEVRNRMPVGALAAADIPGTGTGIVGLAERTSLAGGRLEHGRTDAGDYRLWAWLPWPT